MPRKLTVAVLFGGMSSEHEVSCISAAAVLENLSGEKYDIVQVGITKKGRWLLYPGGPKAIRNGSWEQHPGCLPAVLSPDRDTHGLLVGEGLSTRALRLDVVFPVLHGTYGEDGALQGLLDLAAIPYVGSGRMASAQCMDKAQANRIFDFSGIPHTPWMAVAARDAANLDTLQFHLREKISFPIFVKPASGGSSVGVTKVKKPAELRAAVKTAATQDDTLIFEQAVVGAEVEVALLGNIDPIVSLPGEIESCNEVYDYEAKYESGDASRLYLPARLAADKLEEVRALALAAWNALGCRGLARADFFVEKQTGRVLINEVNTLPGFTPISMYPKLMAQMGIAFPDLVDRLILLAQEGRQI